MELFKESDLEFFKEGNLAVNCKTEELAKEFLAWCVSKGIKTIGDNTFFSTYKNYTCYVVFNRTGINFSGLVYFEENGYFIKEFKGFNKQEIDIILDFLGKTNFYERMSVLVRNYPELSVKDLEKKDDELVSILIRLLRERG